MSPVEHIANLARRFRIVDDDDLEQAMGKELTRKVRAAAFSEARARRYVTSGSGGHGYGSLLYEGEVPGES